MATSSSSMTAKIRRADRSPESFDSLRRRNAAVLVLQSFEKLSWHSFNRRESLQQTRLHFQNMVAGFSDGDEAALVDLPLDNTPRQRDSRQKSSGKGKERSCATAVDGAASPIPASPGSRIVASSRTGEGSKKKRKSTARS